MAVIACPECTKDVSDKALKCPHCAIQLRKLKRGVFGKIVKFSFIVFNILMIFWLFGGMNAATEGMEELDKAGQAGTAIGAGIGAMMIMTIWVIGDIILGLFVLFTRPKAQ